MSAKKVRFTLDLDPMFRRRLKVMAALKGVSMRQYCLAAVERELENDESTGEEPRGFNEKTLERLFALRDEEIGRRPLPGDSVDIIREARELRTRQLG